MSETPDLTEFAEISEATELRRVIEQLQQRLRSSEAKTADLIRAVKEGAREAQAILGNPPEVTRSAPDPRVGKEEVAVLHCSDWQVGKQTESYNSLIAATRVDLLGEKLIEITGIERSAHPVRELHLLLGGDFVEGVSIFPGQAFELDQHLIGQVFTAFGAIERLVRKALSTFEVVHVWETYGNHGRIGRRGDAVSTDNVDILTYSLARERLGEHDGLVWHPATTWHQIFEVGEYRGMLVHGDQIKQFGGNLPVYGIYKKATGWASGVVGEFTDVYMGHFHTPYVIPLAAGNRRVFVNGSPESDNQYAAEFIAATGVPTQRLNYVDPERGRVTSERLIWLGE